MDTNEKKLKNVEWILRIAVFGEFLGHGAFALLGKEEWIGWIEQVIHVGPELAEQLLFAVGIMDVMIAFIVLFRPIKAVILWAAFWALWTALLRPVIGKPIWDFIERFANIGAPLALLFVYGWPGKNFKEWFK